MMQQQVPVAADVIRKRDSTRTQGGHGVQGSGHQMKNEQKVYRGKTSRLMGWQFDISSELPWKTGSGVHRSARNTGLC